MYHQDLEHYIRKFKDEPSGSSIRQEVFREELRTQKLKVAKLGKQNLQLTETRQELKDSRIMVHVEVDETQKFGMQLQNIQGCHERL